MKATNPLTNTRIEFHILQSFPVTCLNRDDVGAPKTAMVGGVQRARVSSQAWKRPVRLAMQEYGSVVLGSRTKFVSALVQAECKKLGATDEQAKVCGDWLEGAFIKAKEPKKGKKAEDIDIDDTKESTSDALIFLSPKEVTRLAELFAENGFDAISVLKQTDQKKRAKEVASLLDKSNMNAVDIALFGRMVAQAAELNIEAACSFAHAISTHKVANEVEFYTAVDDDPMGIREDSGSAHMGSLEFNSATYYRYVSLDLGQLYQTLNGQNMVGAIESFVKALYVAVPTARQTTQTGLSPWDYAKVLVRKGQALQASFDNPVKAKGEGYLEPSIAALKADLAKKEQMAGSLFGKMADIELGNDEQPKNIDDLIALLVSQLPAPTQE